MSRVLAGRGAVDARSARRLAVRAAACAILASAVFAAAASQSRDLDARLEVLSPSNPEAYLLLAEEIQAMARTDEERQRARELYGLAGALDPQRFGASAALGQASLADTAAQRGRLVRLAVALSQDAVPRQTVREVPQAAMRFAQLLAAYRRGDGVRARELIARPEVQALVDANGAAFEGGAAGFRNAVAALRDKPLEQEARRMEWMFMEQALLATGGGMASDLLRSGGEPLAACDPLDPGPELGVDAAKATWRGGRWVEAP